MKPNSRDLVLEALLSIEREDAYSHVVVSGLLEKYNYLDSREKAFMKRLLEGTLERRLELDYVLDLFSKTPVKKMKPLIRELLRMSTYQILYMDSVPDSAVCNEAVKLAQLHSFHALKGFVNGVLRSISRKKDEIPYPDIKKDRKGALSVRYSMPKWLIEKWDAELGCDTTEKVLQGLLLEKPVTIRLKKSLSEEQLREIRQELEEKGVVVTQNEALPLVWYLEKTEGLKNLDSFQKGYFTVQDASSVLAVTAAGIKQGNFVIDTCAAPGGKMLYAAELTGAEGKVLARDVSEKKLPLMEENKARMQAQNVTIEHFDACVADETYREKADVVLARDVSEKKLPLMEENKVRMQAQNVTIEHFDACVADETYREKADVVLADVPCSGLGVIGKKRDIKYKVSPESLSALPALQKQILTAVQSYVKPGGTLLYSTCTISRAENEEMVAWFLEHFPFRADSLQAYLPACYEGESIQEGYYQFLPGIHDTDGFFIARFVRK